MNINNESVSAVLDFFYFNDIFIFFLGSNLILRK